MSVLMIKQKTFLSLVVSGDLRIVQCNELRKLITKGPK